MATTTKQIPYGILTVTAVQARGLPRMDMMGDTDAYLKISVDLPVAEAEGLAKKDGDDSDAEEDADKAAAQLAAAPPVLRTQVADLADPVWHEKLAFPIYTQAGPGKLYVEAWDQDKGPSSDDFIGVSVVDIPALLGASSVADMAKHQRVADVWANLEDPQGRNVGQVQLLVHYLPQGVFDRMGAKFNKQTDSMKTALSAKIVAVVTDMTASKIKGMFSS
ncbi:hypothetical protein AMAG_12415 [Allomyces macrogynus ATCC 38327]|uniref:C2 domain-containing protein n=1 Tax=Allomyces macrogynus (strain ATCC 38327) TaxID=578462 RepID=A0A0L0SZ45_ALLM3|nr:hypothetical protein AMAG_12415 [Allomyces macrogynus ATCC 38327]|eukprot:KNE67680.1 hypothetical protein AMAG_12415 [Allomyces macrogynus ATCC 38327]